VNLHTYTGWGSVPYWNAFVANLELHGSGAFYDPRLNDATKFPVAARAGFGNVRPASAGDDGITSRLPSLQYYQLSIPAPAAPVGSVNQRAADEGQALFNGRARCSSCHVPPLFTEPGWSMHTAEEIGIDDFQARRSPDNRYRTTPLKGAWSHAKGGYYHDGRFATLRAVVEHYDQLFGLRLTETEINDLVEYLKSL
jgi:mono/diheme cytochrome c family protein